MIPQRFIQTGPKDLPLALKAGMMNVRLLHPTFEYLFFDDANVESFVQKEFPQYHGTLRSYRFPIQRYDLFRYLAIYRYGGFYLDLDVFLAESLVPLLTYDCVFPFEKLTNSTYFWDNFRMDWHIGNYAFGASPGHPFLAEIIENCVRANRDPDWVAPMIKWTPKPFRDEAYVLNSTGPGLISRTLGETSSVGDLHILFPKDVCDPRQWHRFGDFGVHHMAGSWRKHRGSLLRPLRRLWIDWDLRRTLARSRTWGSTRELRISKQNTVSPLCP